MGILSQRRRWTGSSDFGHSAVTGADLISAASTNENIGGGVQEKIGQKCSESLNNETPSA
jgi:hypothetical protein